MAITDRAQRVLDLAKEKHGRTAISEMLGENMDYVKNVIDHARKYGRMPPPEIDTAYIKLCEDVLNDWVTGAFTRNQLAEKHSTTKQIVANIMNAGRARGDARARRCDEVEAARNPAPPPLARRGPTLAEQLGIKIGPVIVKERNLRRGGQAYNIITLSGGLVRERVDA